MSRRRSAAYEAWRRWHPCATYAGEWIRAITTRPDLISPSDPLMRLVLLALALRMRPHEVHVRATHAQLAAMTALAERTVRDRLSLAITEGWLIVHGPRTRRAYELTTPTRLSGMRHRAPDAIRRAAPDATGALVIPLCAVDRRTR